ncbi:MAG: TraR/DksA family transcriptional regulator [Nitrospinaceae bacterium]|nr:TraR/DksA family transcriptional regulator [Nitrospinaceae bacterium]
MNETALASLRTKLEEIRAALMGEVKNNIQSKKDKPNEQVADIADDAAQSYDRQLMMEIGEQEWKKLRLVEEALGKISQGQYGICPECEEPIPEARLSVIPFAEHCVGCLEAIENKNS